MTNFNAILGLATIWLACGSEGSKVQRIPNRHCLQAPPKETIYQFEAEDLWKTKNISLSDYAGKVSSLNKVVTYICAKLFIHLHICILISNFDVQFLAKCILLDYISPLTRKSE